jgi:hypothetical protein
MRKDDQLARENPLAGTSECLNRLVKSRGGSDLTSENVLDALKISEGVRKVVTLEGCYGLHGRFACDEVEVISVLEA